VPLADEVEDPDGDVELTPPDVDGELTLPVAGELTVLPDGELVLTPVPLVAPVRGVPDAELPPVTDPETPVPDCCVPLLIDPDVPVVGEADGLPATPAACIACWLQRSKSARVIVPWPIAATGERTAAMAAADPTIFPNLVMSDLLQVCVRFARAARGRFKFTASTDASPSVRFAQRLPRPRAPGASPCWFGACWVGVPGVGAPVSLPCVALHSRGADERGDPEGVASLQAASVRNAIAGTSHPRARRSCGMRRTAATVMPVTADRAARCYYLRLHSPAGKEPP
jgi:hypothetical protein